MGSGLILPLLSFVDDAAKVKRALERAAPTELVLLVLLSLVVVALVLLDEDGAILLELDDEKMPLLPPATPPSL